MIWYQYIYIYHLRSYTYWLFLEHNLLRELYFYNPLQDSLELIRTRDKFEATDCMYAGAT